MNNRLAPFFMILLYFASLGIWFMSVASTNLNSFNDPGDIGILNKMPVSFYISIILLFCALGVSIILQRTGLIIYGLFLCILILFGTYTVIEPYARMGASYYPAAMVRQIINEGHILQSFSPQLNPYLYFSGFQIFTASLVLVCDFNLDYFIKYFHLLLVLIVAVQVFTIGKRLFPENKAGMFLAPLVVAALFSEQIYYSPQMLAYIFLILWFLFLIFQFTMPKSVGLKISMVVVLITGTCIHALTPLGMILATTTCYLIDLFVNRRNNVLGLTISFLLLIAVIYIAYLIYVAEGFTEWSAINLLRYLSSSESFFSMLFFGRQDLPGEAVPVKQLHYYSRVFYYFIYIFIPLIIAAVFVVRSFIKQKIINGETLVIIGWFTGQCFMMVLLYSGEIINRIFLYGIVASIALVILFLGRYKLVLFAFLFTTLLLHPLAFAGDESYKLTSDSTIKGAKFISEHTKRGELYYCQTGIQYIWYFDPYRAWERFYTIPAPQNRKINFEVPFKYLIKSAQGRNIYLYHFGYDILDDYGSEIDGGFDYIYNNNTYQLYYRK